MSINKIDRVVLSEDVKEDIDSKASKQELLNTKNELINSLNEVYQGISWKSPVPTFSDLRLSYPDPKDGWKAVTMDTNITYQYDLETDEWFVTSINALPIATPVIDGLISKDDKSKLDTIAAGAQKNLTPSQTLEQIKTIDGENSGLDADLFHGRKPDTFADKDHDHHGEYYTKTESNTLLNGKSNKAHKHNKVDITDFEHEHPADEITGFGEAVKSTILTGISFLANAKVIATDSIVDALGKLQSQINEFLNKIPTKNSQLDNDSKYVTQSDLGSAGYGDMTKSTYDTNNNGKVDIAENAEKINGFTVGISVPANAKFTDTIYSHPPTHPASMIIGLPTSLPANGGNATTSKALIGDDTRNVNSPPSEYMSGGSRYYNRATWQTEFKNISTIGLSGLMSGIYCYLETKNPWSDSSGGYPIQIAYGSGEPKYRVGISQTAWSEWKGFTEEIHKGVSPPSDTKKMWIKTI